MANPYANNQPKNQIYDAPPRQPTSQPVGEPPAIGYGAQGMRGRLYRLGAPSLGSRNQIAGQAVQSAARRIRP